MIRAASQDGAGRGPHISVLIPTWGRPEELARCLACLTDQIPAETELLTIHAPSDEPSISMVRARFPAVRILESPERNLAFQRNLGAQAAKGEVLLFIDDDAWPRPGWLLALTRPFEDPGVAATGGRVLHPDGSEQGRPLPAGLAPILPGGNMAVRRGPLAAAGGFDENYGYHFDDVDLSLRLHRAGFRLLYVLEAEIFHSSAPGPHRKDLWDRDWYTVTKNSVYFARRHCRPFLKALLGPLLLQAPKTVRFLLWTAQGKLGPSGLVRCLRGQLGGLLAGYLKGWTARPVLPLAKSGVAP